MSEPQVAYNVPVTIQEILEALGNEDPTSFMVAYKTETGVQVYMSEESDELATRFAAALADLALKLREREGR